MGNYDPRPALEKAFRISRYGRFFKLGGEPNSLSQILRFFIWIGYSLAIVSVFSTHLSSMELYPADTSRAAVSSEILPANILVHIVQYLPDDDVRRVRLVCKNWRQIADCIDVDHGLFLTLARASGNIRLFQKMRLSDGRHIIQVLQPLFRLRRDFVDSNLFTNMLEGVPDDLTPHLPLGINYNVLMGPMIPLNLGQVIQRHQLDTMTVHTNALFLTPEINQATCLRSLAIHSPENKAATTAFPGLHYLGQLPLLQDLDLQRNGLIRLPIGLGYLTRITALDAGLNLLTSTTHLERLRYLRSLKLASNNLESFPLLTTFAALEILDLSMNQLLNLPTLLTRLPSLKACSLDHNPLRNFPQAVLWMPNLLSLSLNDIRMSTVPHTISQLTNLTHLNVACNLLATLPQSLGKLTNLRSFEASGNTLDTFGSTWNFPGLTALNLSQNRFNALPSNLFMMRNLRTLMVTNNFLARIPNDIQSLTRLQHVDFSHNLIRQITNDMSALGHVQTLNLAHNLLRQIPEGILSLTQELTCLNLGYNALEEIPEGIGALLSLRTLFLNHNKLRNVHANLGGLTQLECLSLLHNPIDNFRQTLTTLQALRRVGRATTLVEGPTDRTPLDERRAYEAVVQAEQWQQQDMAEIDGGIRRAEQMRAELEGQRIEQHRQGFNSLRNRVRAPLQQQVLEGWQPTNIDNNGIAAVAIGSGALLGTGTGVVVKILATAKAATVATAAVTTTTTTVTASGGLVATASAFAVANPLTAAFLVGGGTAILVGGTIYGTYRLWCWWSKK